MYIEIQNLAGTVLPVLYESLWAIVYESVKKNFFSITQIGIIGFKVWYMTRFWIKNLIENMIIFLILFHAIAPPHTTLTQ